MNCIDKKMNLLLDMINQKSQEELFYFMKEKYLQVPYGTRESIENFFSKFPYWGSLKADEEDFTEIENASFMLKQHVESFRTFYQDLQDYRSKTILYAILNNWYCYDFSSLNAVMEHMYSHYFDLDIIPFCEKEVFVDLGAYTGDTLQELMAIYGNESFEKIFAYEMSEDSLVQLKENMSLYSNIVIRGLAVSNIAGKGKIENNLESASANVLSLGGNVPITTLDEDIHEPITMLKMDIEGSEKNALEGSKKHIQNEKPKLMISIYHGFQDVILIWQLLKEYQSDYTFYLRYYGGPIFPTEIVLYAI